MMRVGLRYGGLLILGLSLSLASSACRRDAAGGDKGAEKKAPPHPHRLKLESLPELGQPLSLPGGASAVYPSWSAGNSPRLSWTRDLSEDGGTPARLMTAVWKEGKWQEEEIADGQSAPLFVNWADFGSVREIPNPEGEEALLADYRVRLDDQGSRYGIRLAIKDAGGSWRAGPRLHEQEDGPEYGFVSSAPDREGGLRLWWLAGQAHKSEPGKEGKDAKGHHGHALTSLWSGRIDAGGALHDLAQWDARVCDCCQTAAASFGGKAQVAYRDRSKDEKRDIRLSARRGVNDPGLPADGWVMPACPVNGPALYGGEGLSLAWFTGDPNPGRVQLARWSAAASKPGIDPVDQGHPLGRVDVVEHGGRVYVSWMEFAGDSQAFLLATAFEGDKRSGTVRLAELSGSRGTGFPRMRVVGAPEGDELWVAWTREGEGLVGVRARLDDWPSQ